jgi:probable F420-dependent oxidoreductase
MHPFRFGVMCSRSESGEAWASFARRVETLGYSTLLVTDHLGRQLEPVAALATAAAATTRLRIGSYVLANDYRHPLMMAREAATLDLLSGGRFELGLGAGWKVEDYRMLGLPYDLPPQRVDRLAEALPLVGRLLAGEVVDHEGPHYRLGGATVPRPVQQPRPPILVGAGGPRMLRLAAREADIVAMQPQFDPRGRPMIRQATEGATARKVAIVREAAGPRFEQLELNVIVADAGLVQTPYVLYGTLGGLRDRLLRRRDRLGISYYALPRHSMEAMAPLVAELSGR